MTDIKILEIRKHLKKKLEPMRFEHTLGVSYTCQALAMRYEYDLKKAELAGLLHDCAKRFDAPTMLEKCRIRQIPITVPEEEEPSMLHAKLGAWMAKEKYGVEDEEVLNAIACHTTGKPGMTLLDKILYVADYIEPGRFKAENLGEMRKLAFIDLDLACFSIMDSILEYLKASGGPIDPMTALACEDMRRVIDERIEKGTENTEAAGEAVPESKEGITFEPVKRDGKARSRSIGRKKRRRYQNHRY